MTKVIRTPLKILEHQILKWEKQIQNAGSKKTLTEFHNPTIAITGAYGSLAGEISKIVANELHFDIFDRELVEEIALSANVRARVVDSLDDRLRDWISRHVSSLFEKEILTPSDYLHHLSKVVFTIAKHGNAVIIGRGAQFLLHPETTLRIRTTAPLDVRINNIAKKKEITTDKAKAIVLKKDTQRAAFWQLHFNQDITCSDHYDLIINTTYGSLKQHAKLVTDAFSMRFKS